MADCHCAGVLRYGNGVSCAMQKLPLRYTLYVKNATGTGGPALGGRDLRRVGRAATIALLCVGILTCVSLAALVAAARLAWANRRAVQVQHSRLTVTDADDKGEAALSLGSYSYQELEHATGDFREAVGRGAFGTVFRGTLPDGEGERAIAVKRLEKVVEEGECEFQREVRAIGRTSHRNLVRLLGFCHEGAHRLLVYEYVSKLLPPTRHGRVPGPRVVPRHGTPDGEGGRVQLRRRAAGDCDVLPEHGAGGGR
jgi:hypothetical protein